MTDKLSTKTDTTVDYSSEEFECVREILISTEDWTAVDRLADKADVDIDVARAILADLKEEGVAWVAYSGIAQVDENWAERQKAKELAAEQSKGDLIQRYGELQSELFVVENALRMLDEDK